MTLHLNAEYAEQNEDFNEKDPKFKVGDRARISKYKNIFSKGYIENWSEEVFIISKIKSTVPWTYVISDLNGELITGIFYEKQLQQTNQKEKVRSCTSNGKDTIIRLIVGLIKETLYKNESILS